MSSWTPRGRVIICMAVVAGALAFRLTAGAGGCTPALGYSAGTVTCYRPSQVVVAERHLSVPPVSPVAAVWQVTRLRLSQLITLQIAPRPGQTGRSRVIALNYVFGPLGVFRGGIPDPPPARVKFVVVDEVVGRSPWKADVHISRGLDTSNTGPNGTIVTAYSAWDLAANVPGHHLFIDITSNESYGVLIKVAAHVVAHPFRCGASQTDNGLEVVQCTYVWRH